ncbi:efflux RND transporter periplasmic adaptor subunit [Lacunimicrobium album]
MNASSISKIGLVLILLSLSACEKLGISQGKPHDEHGGEHGEEHGGGGHEAHHAHLIKVTKPVVMDVTNVKKYVCQIHSRRHIDIRALQEGYLEEVKITEGQGVKKGDVLFSVNPALYQARLDAEIAEMQLAKIERDNAARLLEQKVVSSQDVLLKEASLKKAEAEVALAQAELNFATVKAPFDGIVDRLHEMQGSLVEEGDILTTLSDNEVMWVYFPVREAQYFEYKANLDQGEKDLNVELMLANHTKFDQTGKISAIEADFNNETGNIAFRADFPNPNRLLRHGQTGTVLISQVVKDAVVIPQRATYEILDKLYVYVVDQDNVIHQRDISLEMVLDDLFVIKSGVEPNDKIILEGIRQVRDGQKVEFEYLAPEEVLSHLKYKAE